METLNDSIDNIRNLKKTFSKGKPDNNTNIKDFQTENMIYKIKNVKKKKKSKKYNFNNIEPLVDIHETEPSDNVIEGFVEGYKEGNPKPVLYKEPKGKYENEMYEGDDDIYEGSNKDKIGSRSPGENVKELFAYGEKITYDIAKFIVKNLSSADMQTKNEYSEKDILVVKRYVDLCSSMLFASLAAFNWYLVTLYRETNVNGSYLKFPFKNVIPEEDELKSDYLPEEEPFYPQMLPDFLRPRSERSIYMKTLELELFGEEEQAMLMSVAEKQGVGSGDSIPDTSGGSNDIYGGDETPTIDNVNSGSDDSTTGTNTNSDKGASGTPRMPQPQKDAKDTSEEIDEDAPEKTAKVLLMALTLLHYFIKYALAVPDIIWHIFRSFEKWVCNITVMSREKWYILFFVLATYVFYTMYGFIKQMLMDAVNMKFSLTSGTMMMIMALTYGYHTWRSIKSIDWKKLADQVQSYQFIFAWPLMFIIPGLLLLSLIPGLLIAFLLSPGMAASFGCITLIILSFFPIVKFCKGNPMNFFTNYYKVDEHISEYHDMYPLRDDDPVFKQAVDDIISSIKKIYGLVDLIKVSWFMETGQDESFFRSYKWLFVFTISSILTSLTFLLKTVPPALFYIVTFIIGLAAIGILYSLANSLLVVLKVVMKTIHFGLRFFSINIYKYLLPLSLIFVLLVSMMDYSGSIKNITLRSKLNLLSMITIMAVVFFSFIGNILKNVITGKK